MGCGGRITLHPYFGVGCLLVVYVLPIGNWRVRNSRHCRCGRGLDLDRSFTHVGKEIGKAMPSLADCNASSVVAFGGVRFGVEATLAHSLPAVISRRCLIQTMAMFLISRPIWISVRAFAATGSLACRQFSTFKGADVSTIALDKPVRPSFVHVGKAKDDQVPVSAAGFVSKMHDPTLAWVM